VVAELIGDEGPNLRGARPPRLGDQAAIHQPSDLLEDLLNRRAAYALLSNPDDMACALPKGIRIRMLRCSGTTSFSITRNVLLGTHGGLAGSILNAARNT